MGEELYFFKLNRELAATHLRARLTQDGEHSYCNFLLSSCNEEGVQWEIVLEKAQENIDQISLDELWTVFVWFRKRNNKADSESYSDYEKRLYSEMKSCGIEFFFEIDSKTPVRSFHRCIWDYETLTQIEWQHDCTDTELRNLLNYLICYTGILTKYLNIYLYKYGGNISENVSIDRFIEEINQTTDYRFYQLALTQFKENSEYLKESVWMCEELSKYHRSQSHLSSYSIPLELSEHDARETEILSVSQLLYFALGLKDALGDYSGAVKILHSN